MNAVRVYRGIIWHEPPKTNLDTELVPAGRPIELYAMGMGVAWFYTVTSMLPNKVWLKIA